MRAVPQITSRLIIPTGSGEVDAAYLTAALRAGGHLGPTGEVVSVSREPFAAGVGICGALWLLELGYTGAPADVASAPRTAVLKLPSDAESNRAVNLAFGMYAREARCYAELTPTIGVRTPRCYACAVDPGSGMALILLEDLRDWAPGCQVAGATLEQAQLGVDALAALHAQGWERPEAAAHDWLERLDGGVFATVGAAYRSLWPTFADRFAHLLPPGSVELGLRAQAAFEDLQRAATAEAPLTVCHGDYRLDNLLFADDPTEPTAGRTVVLDWQLVHLGPAVEDVALFLTQSLPVELRRRHEVDLLRRWHTAMRCALGSDMYAYPLELAYAHYRRMALHMTVYPVIVGGGMDAVNERGQALAEAIAVRSFTAALDLDTTEFLAT